MDGPAGASANLAGRRRAGGAAGAGTEAGAASTGPPLVGSCGAAGSGKGGPGTFSYWMQVHVQPQVCECINQS